MVMIWNSLAQGDHNYCAILVVINSVLQIALYAPMAIFFINVISGEKEFRISYGTVAVDVLIVSSAVSVRQGSKLRSTMVQNSIWAYPC